MKSRVQSRIILLVFLVGWLMGGCSQPVEEPPAATDTVPAEVQPVTPSPTTEIVELPGLVILLASAQADQSRIGEVLPVVQEAASRLGLSFEQRDSLTLDAVPENLRAVVSISTAEGLQQLIDGLPQVQFVVVDAEESLTIQPNVSALPDSSVNLNAAFLAGYMAAVQSDEYRVGIVSTNDTQGQDYREAFLNGALYFCGNCLPIYPPYEVYPAYAEVAPGASLEQIQQAAYNLQALQVQIVHLAPQLESVPVDQMLAQNGFYIIGSSAPPSGLEGNWVASVLSEGSFGLADVLEIALNGQPLGWVAANTVIRYTGVGEARINHFNEIIEMLETDEIDPLGLVN